MAFSAKTESTPKDLKKYIGIGTSITEGPGTRRNIKEEPVTAASLLELTGKLF